MATAFCSFGYQNFRADIKQIYTPNGISLEFGKQLETQGTTGKKPISYLKSVDLIRIPFKIHLSRRLGVGVESKIDAWKTMAENNIPYAFLIGGKPVSKNRFICTSAKANIKEIDKNGVIVTADLDITLEEYAGHSARVGILTENLKEYD
jgi:hypothetical protein